VSQIRATAAGDIVIIGLTASIEEVDRYGQMVDEVVLKPVSKQQIYEAMARHLEHEMSAPAASKTAGPSSGLDEWGYEGIQVGTTEASGKLRQELVSELISRKNEVNNLLEGPSIDKVEALALELIGLARRSGDQLLEGWATDLVNHATMVRIKKIHESLAMFDGHIERLS